MERLIRHTPTTDTDHVGPGIDGVANQPCIFGNDGGLLTAVDITTVGERTPAPPSTTPVDHLDGGYAVTQFYYGAGHVEHELDRGDQDNDLCDHPGVPGRHEQVYGGDGGACRPDPTDHRPAGTGDHVFLPGLPEQQRD